MNLYKPNVQAPKNEDSSLGKFFGTLLRSSEITHIYHLQSKSYAEHMALGSFYDAIPGLADGVIEAYQGCTGQIVSGYINEIEQQVSPIEYLEILKTYVVSKSTSLFPGNEYRNIINEVDAITTLIDSTLYKLTFLK